MKISASFLQADQPAKTVLELNQTKIDFFHFDIMDGQFVANQTRDFKVDQDLALLMEKPFDVHLMVEDVIKYVDLYKNLNPQWITFHLEVGDTKKLIEYIKKQGIEVGLSLRPDTSIAKLIPYLELIDVVLVMSVEPGQGGQKFLVETKNRIEYLNHYRQNNRLSYLIQVDGGINNQTITECQNADIVVVGSYLTEGINLKRRVNNLQNKIA